MAPSFAHIKMAEELLANARGKVLIADTVTTGPR
jgi:hypothetical protein